MRRERMRHLPHDSTAASSAVAADAGRSVCHPSEAEVHNVLTVSECFC